MVNTKCKVQKMSDYEDEKLVAKLIYDTDEYIYPSAFGCEQKAIKTIMYLLKKEDTLFSKRNIYIAYKDNKIVGIALVINKETKYNFYTNNLSLPNSFKDVYNNYFSKQKDLLVNSDVEIMNLSVLESEQGKGIGKAIMKKVLSDNKNKKIILEVLQNNEKAICLYEKMGFTITKTKQGYSRSKKKPICYVMENKHVNSNKEVNK